MPSVTIRGDEQLIRTFADINDFDDWATPPMRKAGEQLFNRVKTYPPARPDSSYIRTFTLQRSIDWNISSTPRGVTVHVFSSGANQGYGDYEHFVKVEGFQVDIHKEVWDTDQDDLAAEERTFVDGLADAAAERLRG